MLKQMVHSLYGSHPLYIVAQTTLIHSNTNQVHCNSNCCQYMYAACVGLYLGHPQICQYKNLTKEDIIRIQVQKVEHM